MTGAAYKVLQRAYKFGGQPFVRDIITQSYGQVSPSVRPSVRQPPGAPTDRTTHNNLHFASTHPQEFDSAFGKRNAKTMIYAVAGSIMGVGEIVLLPLDVLKIKAQTNPESLQGRGLFKILKDEGMGLYRCVRAGVGRVCVYVCIYPVDSIHNRTRTHIHNMPTRRQRRHVDGGAQRPGLLRALRRLGPHQGPGLQGPSWPRLASLLSRLMLMCDQCLPYLPSLYTNNKPKQLEKYSDATFMQDSIASVAGAIASISVAQPLDVIKTRIQKRDFRCVPSVACLSSLGETSLHPSAARSIGRAGGPLTSPHVTSRESSTMNEQRQDLGHAHPAGPRQEGGAGGLLQGPDAQADSDRPQARLLLHGRAGASTRPTRLDSTRGVVDGLSGMELRVYACSADAAPSPPSPNTLNSN